jgi:general secretion pathway protein C
MTIEKLSLAPIGQFYHQNDKKIILVVTIVLSLYIVAFAAKLTWQFIPSPNDIVVASTNASNAQQDVRPVDTKTNLNKLLALNLFGDADAVVVAVVQEEVTDAPETKLNLLLSGVVASSDPQIGAAVIEYRNAQNTYGIGDKIEGTQVILEEIYADRVIIKNRTARETLMLDGVDFEEANRLRQQNQAIEPQVQPAQTANAPTRGPSPETLQRMRDARAKLQANPESFADFIRLTPHTRDGTPIGYRVAPGADPSLFQEVGLREGDIVTELNGYDLSDLQQGLEALAVMNNAQTLDLEIIRGDEFVSLTVDMPRE